MDGVYESAFLCVPLPSAPPSQCPLHFIDFLFIIPTLPSSPHSGIIAQSPSCFFLSFLSSWYSLMTTHIFSCIICLLWSCWDLMLRAWYLDITEDARVSSALMNLKESFYPETHLLACKCVNHDLVVEYLT